MKKFWSNSTMKKTLLLFAILLIGFNFVMETDLKAHGFSKCTLVKKYQGWQPIEEICNHPSRKNKKVLSYDFKKGRCAKQLIRYVGTSTSNCYIRICFNGLDEDEVMCTPTQEFYLAEAKKWVPAYGLKVGDILLSKCNALTAVSHIEFIPEKPTK